MCLCHARATPADASASAVEAEPRETYYTERTSILPPGSRTAGVRGAAGGGSAARCLGRPAAAPFSLGVSGVPTWDAAGGALADAPRTANPTHGLASGGRPPARSPRGDPLDPRAFFHLFQCPDATRPVGHTPTVFVRPSSAFSFRAQRGRARRHAGTLASRLSAGCTADGPRPH